jgi:hypothetical protein
MKVSFKLLLHDGESLAVVDLFILLVVREALITFPYSH